MKTNLSRFDSRDNALFNSLFLMTFFFIFINLILLQFTLTFKFFKNKGRIPRKKDSSKPTRKLCYHEMSTTAFNLFLNRCHRANLNWMHKYFLLIISCRRTILKQFLPHEVNEVIWSEKKENKLAGSDIANVHRINCEANSIACVCGEKHFNATLHWGKIKWNEKRMWLIWNVILTFEQI